MWLATGELQQLSCKQLSAAVLDACCMLAEGGSLVLQLAVNSSDHVQRGLACVALHFLNLRPAALSHMHLCCTVLDVGVWNQWLSACARVPSAGAAVGQGVHCNAPYCAAALAASGDTLCNAMPSTIVLHRTLQLSLLLLHDLYLGFIKSTL
jgi:hypothetical protein